MDSCSLIDPLRVSVISCENQRPHLWSASPFRTASVFGSRTSCSRGVSSYIVGPVKVNAVLPSSSPTTKKVHRVGDFMTEKKHLVVVKPTTPIAEALEKLVKYKISGFPVVDDDRKLIGVITDYDMLPTSISGLARSEPDISVVFPEVDSNWKIFNELQKLLCKSAGKTVADVMTPTPLVIHENMNLEDAARWLLETKHRRLPVVDDAGNLVGIITRGAVLRATFQNRHLDQSL